MATTFIDGPVEGATLMLRRAPIFLRVVVDEDSGAVDALDQLDDTPGPSERIYVYQRVAGTFGTLFACRRGGEGGGRYEYGEYRHMPEVDGESVRLTEDWRRWAQSQPVDSLAHQT